MKKILIILFLLSPILLSSTFSQQYNKVQITLNDGPIISGKKGSVSEESVSCMVDGQLQKYSLDDVNLVTAKKGSAIKWAGGLGGCCLGTFAMAGVLGDRDQLNDLGVGPYIASSLLMTAVGAGLGYLIGALTDPWKKIYMANYPMVMNRIKPLVSLDQRGKPMIGFSYRF